MKRLFISASLIGLATAAHAQLFTPGADFNMNVTNSPGTSNNVVPFTVGTHVIDGGDLDLTISVVNAANFATTGAQWVVTQIQTSDGQKLSQPDEDWSSFAVGLPAAKPLNFIADYTQWTDTTGVNIDQTAHIFNQSLIANPVPGMTGNGEGTLGFLDAIGGPGGLPQLGGFASPFSIVTNALVTTDVGGELAALEFEPQSFTPPPSVPEPSTWAMVAVGFGFMAWGAMARKRMRELY